MVAKVPVLGLVSVVLLLMMGASCAYDFPVGGRDGWVQNPSENFNHWAERNRFQVNDKLVFRRKKGDEYSVLVVSEADYRACNTTNPIQKLGGGGGVSVFQFDRSGPFFFISGNPARCQSGQKLIVVVLAVRGPKPTPPAATPPVPSPPASPVPSPPTASPVPNSPHASPLPSPPTAAPLPSSPVPAPRASPTAAPLPSSPVPAPRASPSAAPTPSAIAAPAPSPSAGRTPSQSPAPSPSNSQTSPSPSPYLSPGPSSSEPSSTPSPAPTTAAEVPAGSAPTEGPSSEASSVPRPPPSASSYAGASLRTVAAALALGAGTFLLW